MRHTHIRTFEEYSHEDGLEVDMQSYPEYNQGLRQQARKHVDDVFAMGSGQAVTALCKEVGIAMPKDDESVDAAKERAVDYFIKNPERMRVIVPPPTGVVPVKTGDGIVRTNNVGGVHHDRKYTG